MVAALYTRLEATARRLIDKYGKAAHVVTFVNSGPSHKPAREPTEHACMLVDSFYELTVIPDTLIQIGDKSGIISPAVGVVPDTSCKLKIDGQTYTFRAVEPLNPGGLTLLYEYIAHK